MSNFILPKNRLVDENGAPLPGGKLYFYETGTATPLDTFADAGFSSTNANPVEADGDGTFGRIYLSPGNGEYRVKLTKSDGTLVWQVDHVLPASMSDNDALTRIIQVASSPLDYGGVGDGATDDAAALQGAIDGATGVVDLLGKTWRCDSNLDVTSGITLRNGVLDFSQAASPPNEMILIQGSRANATTLTTNLNAGNSSVALTSVSGMAADDWLFLSSSADWDTSGGGNRGELAQIGSIASLTVSFKAPVQGTYQTVSSAAAQRLSQVSRVILENLKIITNPAGSGTGTAVLVECAASVVLRSVAVSGIKGVGFDIRNSAGVRVDGCLLEAMTGNGIGISVGDAARDVVISDTTIRQCATGVAVGSITQVDGVTQFVDIVGCMIETFTAGIYLKPGSNHVNAERCQINGSLNVPGYGIRMDGVNAAIRHCTIVEPSDWGVLAQNNSGAVGAGGITPFFNRIEKTAVYRPTNKAINVLGTGDTYEWTVSGCSVFGPLGPTATGTYDIACGSGGLLFEGNRINGTCVKGASLTTTGRLVVVGNALDSQGSGATAPLTIGGAGGHAIISGNVLNASGASSSVVAVDITGADKMVFVGNSLYGGASSVVSQFTNCDDASIAGNTFYGGTFAVSLTTCTNVTPGPNTYSGQATGFITGSTANQRGMIDLSLVGFRALSANIIQNAAANGGLLASDTSPQLQILTADKELVISWAGSVVTEIVQSVAIPPDFNYSIAPTFKAYGLMSGATDTPTLTVDAYQGKDGSNLGGATGALSSTASTVSIALSALTAGPRNLTVTITPGAHGTNSLWLLAAWIEYVKI